MKREELLAEIGMLIASTCSECVKGAEAELLLTRIAILLAKKTEMLSAMATYREWLAAQQARIQKAEAN